MPFSAHVLRVLIASPGDTTAERDAVTEALHGWNAARAEREQVVLLPRRWETNAVPRLGGSAQSVINDQLVDRADIVIALFDSRLGMATAAAVSGTAEEIERAHAAGRPVHVYFSTEPIPRDADLGQVQALRSFQEQLSKLGLLGTYASPEDLGHQVRQAIEGDLDLLGLGAVPRRPSGRERAVLRARYDSEREQYRDDRGAVRYRTRRERLVVTNAGEATAQRVRVSVESLAGQGTPPRLYGDETPDIIPRSEFSWPLMGALGDGRAFAVVMRWTEGDDEFTETQHLSR